MVDDTPEDAQPSPGSGRPKRSPPTIDLEASEVSGGTGNPGGGPEPEPSSGEPPPHRGRSTGPSAFVGAVSGACAAALVIGAAWLWGWPAEIAAPTPAAPAVNSSGIDDLAARLAAIESKTGKLASAAPDPALAARSEALEKSLGALRGDLAGLREQSDKLAAAVNAAKATPAEPSAPPDLAEINQRIAELERAARAQSAQSAEIAQQNAKPTDDVPLRRIVTAALLDVAVRNGDPYSAVLAAAKSLAAHPDALKPLDGFAASGVPSAASLSRELLALVPKLSPPAAENRTTGSSLVERLQAGAAKLVR